jgi:hypothetical protein
MVVVFLGRSPVDEFGAMSALVDTVRIYSIFIGIPTLEHFFINLQKFGFVDPISFCFFVQRIIQQS